jgi:hypothetical protein
MADKSSWRTAYTGNKLPRRHQFRTKTASVGCLVNIFWTVGKTGGNFSHNTRTTIRAATFLWAHDNFAQTTSTTAISRNLVTVVAHWNIEPIGGAVPTTASVNNFLIQNKTNGIGTKSPSRFLVGLWQSQMFTPTRATELPYCEGPDPFPDKVSWNWGWHRLTECLQQYSMVQPESLPVVKMARSAYSKDQAVKASEKTRRVSKTQPTISYPFLNRPWWWWIDNGNGDLMKRMLSLSVSGVNVCCNKRYLCWWDGNVKLGLWWFVLQKLCWKNANRFWRRSGSYVQPVKAIKYWSNCHSKFCGLQVSLPAYQ